MSEPSGDLAVSPLERERPRGPAFRRRPRQQAGFGRGRRWRAGDIAAALRATLEEELQERAGIRWLAVAFIAGAAFYFALPREPLLVVLAALAVISTLAAAINYHRGAAWRLLTLVALVLAGATAGKLRVDRLDESAVARAGFAALSGRVIEREARAGLRPRIVIDAIVSESAPLVSRPRRVRLTLAPRQPLPPLGARIAANVRVAPVGGPSVPGGYDPHRAAFFQGIGGSGFVLGDWKLAEEPPGFTFDLLVARVRAAAVERIMAVLPGEAGALAAALLVGERSGLSEATNESLRISGLAHILSISGLHMMLVAGTTYSVLRALLALSPALVLAFPVRKIAALAALLTVTVYLTLSGGGAATVRSYVMAAIVFAAILLDRPAISMRNLAIAAFIVVALTPESVMEPGFQMSFAAVAGLVALWEYWRDREKPGIAIGDVFPGYALLRFAMRAAIGVGATTLVAGLATAPFAAYHFERVSSYSLLGNLLSAPLVSLIIMPFGLLALVLMPLGLEALPLTVMGWGIDVLLAASAWVASLPGSQMRAPSIAPVPLLLIIAGMLWLFLWRLRWRLLGLPFIIGGFAAIPLFIDPPDLLVAPEGNAVAVRDASGVLRVSGARARSYVVEQFFDKEGAPPADGASLKAGVACDPEACLLPSAKGLVVSHVRDPFAFAEDCRRAGIIVTALRAPPDCGAPLVIDSERLARYGAHAVRLRASENGMSFRITTAYGIGHRPWESR